MKHNFTKQLLSLIFALLLAASFLIPSFAADDSRSYEFDLTANGEHELQAAMGDILTFSLTLRQTDGESNEIYAFQTEIEYDSSCLRLINNSEITASGLEAHDVELQDGIHAYYINYVSMVGGEPWDSDTLLGTFQFEVICDKGKIAVGNTNYHVSTQDGRDSFQVSAKDVTVQVGESSFEWYYLVFLVLAVFIVILCICCRKRKHKGKHVKK